MTTNRTPHTHRRAAAALATLATFLTSASAQNPETCPAGTFAVTMRSAAHRSPATFDLTLTDRTGPTTASIRNGPVRMAVVSVRCTRGTIALVILTEADRILLTGRTGQYRFDGTWTNGDLTGTFTAARRASSPAADPPPDTQTPDDSTPDDHPEDARYRLTAHFSGSIAGLTITDESLLVSIDRRADAVQASVSDGKRSYPLEDLDLGEDGTFRARLTVRDLDVTLDGRLTAASGLEGTWTCGLGSGSWRAAPTDDSDPPENLFAP